MHGKAVAVPIRFDLINDPDVLRQTLDSIDGVLFPGGDLLLRVHKEMPPLTQLYYKTATEIVKYAIDRKLPLLGICQGYQLLCQIIVDLHESPQEDAKDGHLKRDQLLSECKMKSVERQTVWLDDHYTRSPFLKSFDENQLV